MDEEQETQETPVKKARVIQMNNNHLNAITGGKNPEAGQTHREKGDTHEIMTDDAQ